MTGTLYIISAPSGGGKTSLVNALLAQLDNIQVSISHTTRSPRQGEVDGKNYFFVNEAQFIRLKQEGIFLESARVFENYYGTSKEWVMAQLKAGIDVILEIDWQGMQRVKAQLDTVCIFILPPSREALMTRLKQRAQDNHEVIAARMNKVNEEISHYREYDYAVVNDDFDVALQDLLAIIRSQRLRLEIQQARLETLVTSFSQ
jgi:guanylate kinase